MPPWMCPVIFMVFPLVLWWTDAAYGGFRDDIRHSAAHCPVDEATRLSVDSCGLVMTATSFQEAQQAANESS